MYSQTFFQVEAEQYAQAPAVKGVLPCGTLPLRVPAAAPIIELGNAFIRASRNPSGWRSTPVTTSHNPRNDRACTYPRPHLRLVHLRRRPQCLTWATRQIVHPRVRPKRWQKPTPLAAATIGHSSNSIDGSSTPSRFSSLDHAEHAGTPASARTWCQRSCRR